MRIFWNSVLVTLTASTLACSSGDPVSIGNDHQTTAKTGEFLADYGGVWDGYVEGGRGPAGSDLVHVTLDENGQGYIAFGDGTTWEAPTDPDAEYPADREPGAHTGADLGVRAGFHYTVHNAMVESRRIRFDTEAAESLKAWCELQTSYANTTDDGGTYYSCLPNSPFSSDGEHCYLGDEPNKSPVSCTQVTNCLFAAGSLAPCACDEAGCTSNGTTARVLDGVLENDGNDFVGTLVGFGTVRLTRQ